MRKIYPLLIVLLFFAKTEAQLSLVPVPTPPTTQEQANFSHILELSNWTTYWGKDTLTNSYSWSDPNNGNGSGIFQHIFILRQNGKWLFLKYLQAFDYFEWRTLYSAITPSSDMDPPCNDIWEKHSAVATHNNGLVHTGMDAPLNPTGDTIQINISGNTCIQLPVPVNALILTPNAQSLPQLTNATIAAIPNPQPGMMTWSTDDSCVKVFDGTVWGCL